MLHCLPTFFPNSGCKQNPDYIIVSRYNIDHLSWTKKKKVLCNIAGFYHFKQNDSVDWFAQLTCLASGLLCYICNYVVLIIVFLLLVMQQDGSETKFRVRRNTKLQKLLVQFCTHRSLDMKALAFLFEGTELKLEQTPQEVKVQKLTFPEF